MWIALLAALTAPVFAQEASEDSPEYLLGDVGVRVDLPKKGWTPLEWSDWHFKAETADRSVKISAWATPFQHTLTQENVEAFGETHLRQSKLFGAKNPVMDSFELGARGDVPIGRYVYHFGSGASEITLHGASLPADGQNFHLFAMAAKRNGWKAKRELDGLLKRLEVTTPPEKVVWGGQVEAVGVTSTLPDDWRKPMKGAETDEAKKAVESIGVAQLEDCWVAVRPKPVAKPAVMVTCKSPLMVGVVDEYSFEGVDTDLRARLFGKLEVGAANPVDLPDRKGFVYALRDGVGMSVVPYDQGLAQTWIVAEGSDRAQITQTLSEVATASTYSGLHPAGVGEQVRYYVSYRPFSPMVLCPVLGLLGILGTGVVVVAGAGGLFMRKDKYADLDLDD